MCLTVAYGPCKPSPTKLAFGPRAPSGSPPTTDLCPPGYSCSRLGLTLAGLPASRAASQWSLLPRTPVPHHPPTAPSPAPGGRPCASLCTPAWLTFARTQGPTVGLRGPGQCVSPGSCGCFPVSQSLLPSRALWPARAGLRLSPLRGREARPVALVCATLTLNDNPSPSVPPFVTCL